MESYRYYSFKTPQHTSPPKLQTLFIRKNWYSVSARQGLRTSTSSPFEAIVGTRMHPSAPNQLSYLRRLSVYLVCTQERLINSSSCLNCAYIYTQVYIVNSRAWCVCPCIYPGAPRQLVCKAINCQCIYSSKCAYFSQLSYLMGLSIYTPKCA